MASWTKATRKGLAAVAAGAALALAGTAGADTVEGYTRVSAADPGQGTVTILSGPCRVASGASLRRITGHEVSLAELAGELAGGPLPARYVAERNGSACTLSALKIVDAIPD